MISNPASTRSRSAECDIHDVRLGLEGAFDMTAGPAAAGAPASSTSRLGRGGTLAWILAAAAMTGAAALAFGHFRETRSAQHAVRFQVPPPEKSIISSFALSPDGRVLRRSCF